MREGALFGTMFGLGVGAVLVGVTVSRLVVGQAPEQPAEEPPPAAAEAPPPAIFAPPPAALVSPAAEPPAVASSAVPPAAVVSPAEPPAEAAIPRQRRTVVRKHGRAPVQEETPLATAAVPSGKAEAVVPPPTVVGDPPIGIVRGGAARPSPGARAPGPRIIQVEQDGGR
jgi:hypothetical protein